MFEYGSEASEVGVPIDDECEHDQQAIEEIQSSAYFTPTPCHSILHFLDLIETRRIDLKCECDG